MVPLYFFLYKSYSDEGSISRIYVELYGLNGQYLLNCDCLQGSRCWAQTPLTPGSHTFSMCTVATRLYPQDYHKYPKP